jgi:hypothetical protein
MKRLAFEKSAFHENRPNAMMGLRSLHRDGGYRRFQEIALMGAECCG